jgi:hypothetical protein
VVVRRLALCQARHPRAVPVDALAALAARAKSASPSPSAVSGPTADGGASTIVMGGGGAAAGVFTPDAVLERLLSSLLEEGEGRKDVVLLVCGSFYVVAAVRAHLAATRPWLFVSRDDWAFHPDPALGATR